MAHELTDWFGEAVQWFVGANTPPNGTCLYCPGHAAHEPWCPVAKVLAVVAAVPAPPTTAPPTAAERDAVIAARREASDES
jgi:hypothetical protein